MGAEMLAIVAEEMCIRDRFWVKNVGPVYLVMLPAAILCKGWKRGLALGALFVYAAAELIQFQPNAYDNNKLFYVAFLLMLPLAARYLVTVSYTHLDVYKRQVPRSSQRY